MVIWVDIFHLYLSKYMYTCITLHAPGSWMSCNPRPGHALTWGTSDPRDVLMVNIFFFY